MDVLSDALRELGSTSRRLLERAARTSPVPPAFGVPAELDRELWSALAELGLLGLAVPEELGGSGGGVTELCVLAEQVGAALPAVPFAGTAAVAAVLVAGLDDGTDDGVARQVLADLVKGTLVVAPAWETFPAQVVPGRRTALRVSDGRVDGALAAVPFGRAADLVLAFAEPLTAVLLDTRRDGVQTRAVESLDVREPVAAVTAQGVAAPLVRIAAFPAAQIQVALAAELVGTAQRALDGAVAYAKDRRQFGRPIGSFQALKHLLADRHVQLDAARMLVHAAAELIDAGESSAAAATTALVAACDAADVTTGDALQVHGGIGFTWEHPSHVYLRRARARRVLLGSQARQLDGLAQLLLGR
ncbi:acyl-CoA dehydrogenase family protein [Pseudonocardia sp. CA-107938]|uniref:acyl-CoA dehydrogenase family protein n=1 Tax=Pseudonocardia sp. CA-107938 TaxID=3240021 RepID=UPI003D8F5798